MATAMNQVLSKQREIEIEKIVAEFCLSYQFYYPEDHIFDLANKMGISVYKKRFSDPKISAELIRDGSNEPIKIFLSEEEPKERRSFSLAHEIGHLVLHEPKPVAHRIDCYSYGTDDESVQELEANFFAATLLMPKDTLAEMLNIHGDNIEMLTKVFAVSRSAIRNRITWLKFED
jgi:Zn-dependent peptidase ImmA (M78 family)